MRVRVLMLTVLISLLVVACGDDDDTGAAGRTPIDECDWSMFGHDVTATNTQPCESDLSPDTVAELDQVWHFATSDAVSATPTVVDGSVYVGDWSGHFYAIDIDNGEQRWRFDADVHPTVYAGQIVGSATVVDVDDDRLVIFPGGKTMYALDADDGSEVWRHELGEPGDGEEPTEIEASPVVADGKVIFGWDVHNSRDGEPAGVRALDVRDGSEVWTFETAPNDLAPATGLGCGDVWGSVSIDVERELVFFGTGNCTTEEWGLLSEALVAVSLDDGAFVWSFQPHDQNFDDLDFAGQPNLFEVDGRALVGLGNKDGSYYAVDRETGEETWRAEATQPGLTRPGSNFSTGGFIGSTAYADGLIVGATAVGPPPHLHAIDAATGNLVWQNSAPAASYATTTTVNGVAFMGGTDFTLRAFDLSDGAILWEHGLGAGIAGGAAIVGNDVFAVSGLREPGLEPSPDGVGVTRFSLDAEPVASTTTTTAPPTEPTGPVAEEGTQHCLGEVCVVPFSLTEPPPGTDPVFELLIELDPWKVTVRATGMGDPSAWIREGSPDEAVGAVAFALMASESDSNPVGGLICVLEPDDDGALVCESSAIPRPGATYNRLTVLALADTDEFPEIAEGVNRLVTTISFDPPLYPQD